jgi:hypothetical protein
MAAVLIVTELAVSFSVFICCISALMLAEVRGLEDSLGSPNAAPQGSDDDEEYVCALTRALLCHVTVL